MPNPLLYLQSLATAMAVGIVLGLVQRRSPNGLRPGPASFLGTLGVAAAAVFGFAVLGVRPSLPPQNGLDRFLIVVLPTVLAVEWIGSLRSVSRWMVVLARTGLAAAGGWVLLYDSVYLHSADGNWSRLAVIVALGISGAGILAEWYLLERLAQHTPNRAVELSLGLAVLCAGMLVMLAGYLKGGSAAFPLAGAILGGTLNRSSRWGATGQSGSVGFGILSLFGLVFIGRFFGGLSSGTAVLVFLAPLAGWLPQALGARLGSRWKRTALHLIVVAIPLALLLGRAKLEFDRKMRPLLVRIDLPLARPSTTILVGRGFAHDAAPTGPCSPTSGSLHVADLARESRSRWHRHRGG